MTDAVSLRAGHFRVRRAREHDAARRPPRQTEQSGAPRPSPLVRVEDYGKNATRRFRTKGCKQGEVDAAS